MLCGKRMHCLVGMRGVALFIINHYFCVRFVADSLNLYKDVLV